MTRSLLTNIDFSESRNQLSYDKIIVGMKTKELVSKFTIQVNDFFCRGKEFYLKLSQQLLKKHSINNTYLANLRFFKYRLQKYCK